MKRDELGDLSAFLAVAEERSFTRAAARLGTSQSALSHTVRRLEERLGVRLLTRTTRSVSPTDAGERLQLALRPAFNDIETSLGSLVELREKPAGTVRVTAPRLAAQEILLPIVASLLLEHPELNIEISVDSRLVDIAKERFDAGVRLGELVARDMIAVRISPDLRMAVVGSPAYFETHPVPASPHELTKHVCINLRLPTLGGLYAWEFEKRGRPLNVRVDGQFICNDSLVILEAACAGVGLASIPQDHVATQLAEGRLVRVLEDWCPPFAGYHLYYPSSRQISPALRLLVDALRYKGG
jgi:DNA-binding transcriptional LysR family regulator